MSELARTFPAILGVTLLLVAAQTFLKLAVTQAASHNPESSVWDLAVQLMGLARVPQFWIGVALSGLGFIGWLFVLSRVELSKAVLTIMVLYPTLIMLAGMLTGETRTWQNMLGVIIAIGGLWLATSNFSS